MKLPDKFEFRNLAFPGFTHSAKKNAWGDYEVKWARGYVEKLSSIPPKVYGQGYMEQLIATKIYVLAGTETQEAKLPDEFRFVSTVAGNFNIIVYTATRDGGDFEITWEWPKTSVLVDPSIWWSEHDVLASIKKGNIKILDKKPLTAKQERANKDFRERIAQLDQSIKLNEQDIEHKRRLIANYEAVKKDLQAKIVEEV